MKMLAKEIIEDSLISFLTREVRNNEVDDKEISERVFICRPMAIICC